MRGWIKQVSFAALLGWAGWAQAQQVTLDIQPRVLRLTEAATLTLSFAGINNPPVPELANVPGFQVQYVGREQQMSVVNGRTESSVNFRYRMVPTGTGKFRIGPFTLTIGGASYTLQPVEVEVVPSNGQPQSGGGDSQQLTDLLFARMRSDQNRVYAYQYFNLFIDLYYRGVNLDRSISLADLPGSGLDISPFEELRPTREAVGSDLYEVRHFRAQAKALSAGVFTLNPNLRVNLIVENSQPQRDPFGFDMFFRQRDTRAVSVSIEPWTLEVKPIPDDGRPSHFSGAVGQFDFSVQLSRTDVKAGEPITLTARVSGQGNLDTIAMPGIQVDDRFRVYDPKLIEQTSRAGQSGGVKTYEQVLIPRSEDITTIPPLSFSFFDPNQGRFQTITRGPFPLTVHPSDLADKAMVQPNEPVSPAVRKALGLDIVYLKNAPRAWVIATDSGGTGPGQWLKVLPALAVVGAFLWRRRTDSLARDPIKASRLHAPRAARASLATAEQQLDEPAEFYASLWKALVLYFANRLNRDQGEISPALIRKIVDTATLPVPLVQSLDEILRIDEQLRFGGAAPNQRADREQHTRDVADLLRACEKVRVEVP